MKYYLHDSNSFQDEKITELYMNFGYEGLGLFYTILEKFAMQEKPIKIEVLKKQLNIGKRLNKIFIFMESLELISTSNGETFSKQLLNFSEKYKIKKEKNRKRISEWRENQKDTKNVTCNEHVRNSPKVKRSKVNRIKESKNYYLSQINENKNDTYYKSFVDFLFGENILNTQLDSLLKLKNQISCKNLMKLQELAKEKNKKIKDTFISLNNTLMNSPEKYKVLHSTIVNWINNDFKNGN